MRLTSKRRRTIGLLDARGAMLLADPRAHSLDDPTGFWTVKPQRTVLDEWEVVVTFEMANDHRPGFPIAGPFASEEAAQAFCEGFYFRDTEAMAGADEYLDAHDGLEREINEVGRNVTPDGGSAT